MNGRSPTESQIAPDTMLAHYRVLSPIGEGAMGTVYEALDTALDRPVAVKVLRSEISEDADIVRRFLREARAAARVNHKNLTHIYFVGGSVAKLLFHLRVVARDGNRPETRALVYRFLIRYPFAPLLCIPPVLRYGVTLWAAIMLLAFLAVLAGSLCYFLRGRRTLSDVLTGTRVIYRSSDR